MATQNTGTGAMDTFSQSIQEYIQRHNVKPGEQGPRDLVTLDQAGVRTLFQVFNSNPETGLSTTQAEANGKQYGFNEYRKRKSRTLCEIFTKAICDQLLIILMIAAVVSVIVQYFAGEEKDMFWVDGVSILIAVIVCTLVSTISNYQKERQFDQLDKLTQSTYTSEVLRDGRRQSIHRSKIVPGDMIFLTNGIEIPADCILYKAVNVVVNESAITGESHQVYKNVFDKCLQRRLDTRGPTPIMISGASVVSGEGLMMATVVGGRSRAGKNFELIFSNQDNEAAQHTKLQLQLERLASQIGRLGIIAAILIFIILIVRLVVEEIHKGGFHFKQNIEKMVQYLIIAVTVVVVSIPEGLPLAVTLTLAYSMKAMHQDKILVRKLESCQTMGGAKFLCSDKTGTITQNKMTVMHVVNNQSMPIASFTPQTIHPDYFKKLVTAIFHNTAAIAQPEKGAQTEIALIKMARNLTGKKQQDVRKQVGPAGYFKRLPFDSSRKRMTTGLRVDNQDLLFMNGASQQILTASNSIQDCRTNQITQLDQQGKKRIENNLQQMARRGLRTVSIAYKRVNMSEISNAQANRQKDVIQQIQKYGFTMLGVFGIEDPPRQQSKGAIQNCRKAGIKVIMVTGDNKVTAQNISEQVGIIGPDSPGKIWEASQFMNELQRQGLLKEQPPKRDRDGNQIVQPGTKMKKVVLTNENERQKFSNMVNTLAVMARSKPQHKYILVDGINKLGHIVGVTGDGANDAPALMRADIGLAMGITGTQVSKNASDIIILDDNFNSIVRAVIWGRNVYTSIRRFLQFQLTVNIIAVCIVLISAAIIRQSVLASVQMLWVNLIMDSLAALALATQPPNEEQLLNQAPNSPDQRLLTRTMLKHIFGQAVFQLTVLVILLFFGQRFIPQSRDSFDDIIKGNLQAKYFNGQVESTVTDGKFYTIAGEEKYKIWFDKYHNHSRHFTFIFNTFVFLQVFNFICCRRIKDQLNLFSRLCGSKLFWIIVAIIVILQFLVITFGGRFFQLYKYNGLNAIQWLISVGIGSLTVPVSIFLRLLPCFKPELKRQQQKFIDPAIQSQDKSFIKPAGFYNHLAGALPFIKVNKRSSNQQQIRSQIAYPNLTDQERKSLPYGFEHNYHFNSNFGVGK